MGLSSGLGSGVGVCGVCVRVRLEESDLECLRELRLQIEPDELRLVEARAREVSEDRGEGGAEEG